MPTVESYLKDLQYHKATRQPDPNDALFCSYLVCLDEGKELSQSEIYFLQQHIDHISIDFLLVYDHKSLVINSLVHHRKKINSLKVFEYAITSKPTYENIKSLGVLEQDEIDVIIKNISSFEPPEIIKMIDAGIFKDHLILTFDYLLRACLYHGNNELYEALTHFFIYAKTDTQFYPEIDDVIFHLFLEHRAFYELINYSDYNLIFSEYIYKLALAKVPFAQQINDYLHYKNNLANF